MSLIIFICNNNNDDDNNNNNNLNWACGINHPGTACTIAISVKPLRQMLLGIVTEWSVCMH